MEYLTEWFSQLNATRRSTVIAGLGGGKVLPERISFTEIRSWALLTDSQPNHWEVNVLFRMDQAYLAAKHGKQTQGGNKHQALGEYCQGAEIDTCRKQFGSQLELVCRTCPN